MHVRSGAGNELLQITHMLDTWWINYWKLFEVLI